MYSVTRNRETIYGKYIFKYHPDYKDTSLYFRRDSSFHTEGGDVLNINEHTIAVGISQRTQAAAIDVMAQNMFWNSDSKIDTTWRSTTRSPVPSCTWIRSSPRSTVTSSPFIPPSWARCTCTSSLRAPTPARLDIVESATPSSTSLRKALGIDAVKLIPCGGGDPIAAAREQWNDGSNTLAVAPGKICVYQRNTVTNDVLYKEGMELLVVPSAELSRGRGGPRCMSMPFWREDVVW